ncbi:MAG: DUF4233 domain-containing protein [Candidatus Nanopelagicales bacterium]|jgi:hypothetical protein|nr:DUF4233 domain-containing protein [Candidatus Nanopelagicales bacterium]
MRVIGSATLIFQAIVFALAIPVAAALRPGYGGWVAGILLVLSIVGAATARRGDIIVGTTVQVISVLASFFTPIAIPLALIFAGLWATAVYYGRKADAADAARAQGE